MPCGSKGSKFECASCEGCPFFESNPPVPPVQPTGDVRFIIVGEGPGRQEVSKGEPFIGDAGKLLDYLLQYAGLSRSDAYITNATMCYPRGKKAKTLPVAVASCRARLKRELEMFPDDTPVLTLGAAARDSVGLTTNYLWSTEDLTGKPALPVLHPAAALYRMTQVFEIVMGIKKFAAYVQSGTFSLYPRPSYPKVYSRLFPDISYWDYDRICIDLETNNKRWWGEDADEILWMGIAGNAVGGDPREDGSEIHVISGALLRSNPEWTAWLFEKFAGRIGGHNFKFDLNFLRSHLGLQDLNGDWDTILMVRDYQEHWPKSLKFLANYFYDVGEYDKDLIDKHFVRVKEDDRNYREVPVADMIKYLSFDVHYNLMLSYDLEDTLKASGRWERPYSMFNIPLLHSG